MINQKHLPLEHQGQVLFFRKLIFVNNLLYTTDHDLVYLHCYVGGEISAVFYSGVLQITQ